MGMLENHQFPTGDSTKSYGYDGITSIRTHSTHIWMTFHRKRWRESLHFSIAFRRMPEGLSECSSPPISAHYTTRTLTHFRCLDPNPPPKFRSSTLKIGHHQNPMFFHHWSHEKWLLYAYTHVYAMFRHIGFGVMFCEEKWSYPRWHQLRLEGTSSA